MTDANAMSSEPMTHPTPRARRIHASLPLAALVCAFALTLVACGGGYLQTDDFSNPASFRIGEDAQVEDTEENRAVLGVVERYRDAMSARNANAIRSLVASQYYENASTTNDPNDDYGNEKLEELLSYYLSEKVREVRYDVEIKQIVREQHLVHVDYLFFASFRYVADGRDVWKSGRDVNRITLIEENGEWKITGGL